MSELPATGNWPAPPVPGPADWPVIPGYEVLEELGRGGMGVVYKARQMAFDRLVALKLIRDGALASPQERARFHTETEVVARLQHPNVVQIYETGEHVGRSYFTMEFVECGSLASHLTAGTPALSAQQSAELVRILALAVEYAHSQKIVHRDLKPGNILLQQIKRPGGRGDSVDSNKDEANLALGAQLSLLVPKITDFGLAKRLDRDSTAWTQDGAVLGTPSYMAPEQAEGRVRDIGLQVDVYALGAILYEMLTGRPPFQAGSWNQTIEQVLHDEPVPPTRLQPAVPLDLETICLKCLEKEPSRRYGSASELADDLSRFLEGQSVTAVPLSARERLDRLAARDGYQVVNEIGRGPRSTVYVALYGPLKLPVALKVFTAGICTQQQWEGRIRHGTELRGNTSSRESLVAALNHPNIIPVQQAGWWDGAPYLAVEYAPHGSLAAELDTHRFDVRDALRFVAQLAEIVIYIHRQGVVHGNLKPTNVLLAADGIPRIVDFQRIVGPFQSSLLANDPGAPAPAGLCYLAPELVVNPLAELRPYTDIYGLGVVLYALLTGRPPFAAPSGRELLEQIRSQDPVPPSRLNPQVSPELEAFCVRCLHKNPWRRHRRAHDVLKRLQYFQQDC